MLQPTHTRIIVNADDFGLTPGINQAIGELADAGKVSSATLMAGGAALEHAVRIAQTRPHLGVGCHIVLVDGKALSPLHQVSTLAGENGEFRSSLAAFALALQRGTISEKHIETEAATQIRRLQSAGLTVTHVDCHKHAHLLPAVARPVMRAAMQCGIRAIRNPFEPPWSLEVTPGAALRKLQIHLLRRYARSFHQLRRAAGLATTDGCVGIAATGRLNADMLRTLLDKMPPGTWELVCHPGYRDGALSATRTRLKTEREVERLALLSTVPANSLINFGDLG